MPFAGLRRKAMENPIMVEFPSFILSFLLLLCFVFLSVYSQEGLTTCLKFSEQIGQFVGDNISLAKKVDFLINFFNTCKVRDLKSDMMFLFFSLFPFFTSFLLSQLILRLIKLPTYRFVVFTEVSKRERDKYFRRVNSRKNFWWIVVVAGFIIGVSASIFASYLLEWLGNIFG